MGMDYQKLVDGTEIYRTLSAPAIHGLVVVVFASMVLMWVPSTSPTSTVMPGRATASVQLFPSLGRKQLTL